MPSPPPPASSDGRPGHWQPQVFFSLNFCAPTLVWRKGGMMRRKGEEGGRGGERRDEGKEE